MKNTEQSRKFLMDLAEQEDDQFDGFTGYDNGILQASKGNVFFKNYLFYKPIKNPLSYSNTLKRIYCLHS